MNIKEQTMLIAYMRTIDQIDDYFEYRNVSIEDREFVHKTLDSLTEKLAEIADKA